MSSTTGLRLVHALHTKTLHSLHLNVKMHPILADAASDTLSLLCVQDAVICWETLH